MSDGFLLSLRVNGDALRVWAPACRTLLELLREDLGLTGSKRGCDMGDCGACTVLVDGEPRLACLTLAAECEGRAVVTVEGLASAEGLHPIQQAFDETVGAQCGYCTPGFLVNLAALFERDPDADDDALREALGANLCRCTGYTAILAAARLARERRGGKA